MKPCYFCNKDDLPTYFTAWARPGNNPKKGTLIWMCRRHLSPVDMIIDAHTGNLISMYGEEKYQATPDRNSWVSNWSIFAK